MNHRLGACAILLAGALDAAAWDPAGHMLIGQIAWEHTSPEARAETAALCALLPNRYNEGRSYNFVTVGCWLDDMRSKPGYAWSKWHYVTVPWTSDASGFQLPAPPHVVSVIADQLQSVRRRDLSAIERAESLAILIHCLGDVHQPLHATDRGDRGGNGVLIFGVPFSDLWPGTVPNLHAFWDKAYRFDRGPDGKIIELWRCAALSDRPANPGEGIIATEAEKIVTENPTAREALRIADFQPADWALESHREGCRAGYPAEFQPGDDGVVPLDGKFANDSRAVASRRIALAGFRLAAVLNTIFAAAPRE